MGKRNKIIYWIATLWLSLGMVSTGIEQLMKMKEGAGGLDSVTHLGFPPYLPPFLGISKLLGVIVILLPQLPRLKEWAYAGFFFIIAGALFAHSMSGDAAKEFFGPVLLLILISISWYFRPAGRKMVAGNG